MANERKTYALVLDDDVHSLSALAELVEAEGFQVARAKSLEEARAEIESQYPDLILADLILPDGRGTELFEELEGNSSTEVILVTGKATVETAVEALRLGAYDYLTKPVDLARLKTLLARVRDTRELKKEVSNLRAELRELGRFGPLVGTSTAMQTVYDMIDKVAPTDATVLLVGESGTGKELAALTVHRLSKRRKGTYLPLNCGAVSPTLIESELFGHEKGSFTGASRQHRGYFERTSSGTLFLDEITEMPMELQVKLLRVLETGKILRVGGDREVGVDVRVLAATNQVPEEAVEKGKLREDLLYRLKVFPIYLPPLRDREGDIEMLANFFLSELNKRGEESKRFTTEALDRMREHSWPGNVRELQNVVQRAYILADDTISSENLPADMGGDAPAPGPRLQLKVGASIEDAERRLILATLDEFEGDKKRAAETLGVSLKTLYNRLNRYKEEEEAAAS